VTSRDRAGRVGHSTRILRPPHPIGLELLPGPRVRVGRVNPTVTLIFVIIDCYTKIIKYISIIIRINIAKLAKVFFDKIILCFEMLTNIISNKEFIFTSIF